MKNPLKSLVHTAGRWYISRLCRTQYETQRFLRINERPIEYAFLFKSMAHLMPSSVVDIGTGTTALPSLLHTCGAEVTAIDNVQDYWPAGMHNRHWHVIDDDVTSSQLNRQFEFLSCISVLEHIIDFDAAVQAMFSMVTEGGHLVLSFPYNEKRYVENVYVLPQAGYGKSASYVCQVYSRMNLDYWLRQNGGKIVLQEYWQVFSGEFWTFGHQLHPPRQTARDQLHQLTCLLIRKHSGAKHQEKIDP